MKALVPAVLLALALSPNSAWSGESEPPATSSGVPESVQALLHATCLMCHSERTSTPLDLESLDFSLSDRKNFVRWLRIYDRVRAGEMPPRASMLPDPPIVEGALESLAQHLEKANVAARDGQRVGLRRLTRLEYQYTIQDLLRLDAELARDIAVTLPAEADTGGFDVVADKQGISPLHVRAYLDAASAALSGAIALGERPELSQRKIEYAKSSYLSLIEDGDFLGAGILKKVDDGAAIFFDTGSTYTMHSQSEGWAVPARGRYRVRLDAYPYQAKTPVVVTLYRGQMSGSSAVLNDLLMSRDLMPDAGPTMTELTAYLRPGDVLAPSLADVVAPPGDYTNYYAPENNVDDYPGEGLVVRSLEVEGPLYEVWPPESTRELLVGLDLDSEGEPRLERPALEHIDAILTDFLPRAFRRPVEREEHEAFYRLAEDSLEQGDSLTEALTVSLRAALTAPQFLYHGGSAGELDDYALASRLSYFLWRSMPDAELTQLAASGRISEPEVLRAQVDRLLEDPKSQRFVEDFVGQAYRLYELLSTSPDGGLYPEFDSRLAQAIGRETELFFGALIEENLGVSQLADSDFTFLNRRLAEHYGIAGVKGTEMRKVRLPETSVRGGLLTQASVHKVTANGTTTSPVPRGNFVLANLLGRPAPPPPAGVEGLEPDIRGATTIREQLDLHRHEAVCNSCHRRIDPPGFALEAFDPIGGYREQYRISGGTMEFDGVEVPMPYKQGPAVDASGVTPGGKTFQDVREYKQLLIEAELEQLARHLVSQLVVFATGAEVDFADRPAVEAIVAALEPDDFPVKAMIHAVVESDLFRRR